MRLLDLSGKTIVVTGATSGIGLAATLLYVRSGAFVIGVGRSEKHIQTASDQIIKEVPKGYIKFLLADLAVQQEVNHLAEKILNVLKRKHRRKLDVLVNNAGGYLERKQMTVDGIERTFAVNYLASFLLTNRLMPVLTKGPSPRVLTVTSYSHRTTPLNLSRICDPWPYIGLLAYKRSKLCNVLFTYELNRRCPQVTAFAVDPGLVNTAIASKGGRGISHWVWRRKRLKGTSAEVPAQTLLYLAGDENIDTQQGFYFKNCSYKNPSKKAKNPQLAEKLWQLSCQLTGVQWLEGSHKTPQNIYEVSA